MRAKGASLDGAIAQIASRQHGVLTRRQLIGVGLSEAALAFEDDHERDLELRLLGYEVIRVSYRQVTEAPNRVVAVVGQALGNA